MRIVLSLALLASLALNVWQWWSRPATSDPVPLRVLPVPEPHAATPSKPTTAPAASQVAQRAPAPPEFEVPRALLAPATPPRADRFVSPLTPELQQDLLSQIAREKLRDQWKHQEGSILSSLRGSLGDPARQHGDAEREGRKLAVEAGLDPAMTDRFTAAYEAQRQKRLAALLQAIAPDPPDWSAALEQARGLFADEDALAQSFGGDGARSSLRFAQAEGRTVILAIGASLAGAPWEQTVRW